MQNNLWRITIDTNPEDCNLNCIMCEEHSIYSNYIQNLFSETGINKRRMPFEWIEKIFRQAKEIGVKEIIPSTMGEPFLYDHIEQIISLAKQNNIKLNLTSNGTFPKHSVKEWAELIIPYTSDIKFSVNGASKETAESIMSGIDFTKAIKNISKFISYRNEHYKKTGYYCCISFQLTFMQSNMHELSDIIRMAAEMGVDRIKGHHVWVHFDQIKNQSFKYSSASIKTWNNYVVDAHKIIEEFRKPDGKRVILENINPLKETEISEVPYEYECPFLNKELWISATGKISPCCAPDDQRNTLGNYGNIENTKLKDVLNSKQYEELLGSYKEKTLCKSCNMRKPL